MESSAQNLLFGLGKIKYLAPFVGLCAAYGFYRLLGWSYRVMCFFGRNFLRTGYNLHQRYGIPGKDTFAVVTGGSDGLGFCICDQMAATGFNICMIARNEAKMKEKCAEIQKRHPSIKVMYIVADF